MITRPIRCVSLNSWWEGYSSTRLKALVWKVRRALQVRTLKRLFQGAGPEVILVQEMGKEQAAQFFADMGDAWEYDRFNEPRDKTLGLNCVGWRKDRLRHVATQQVDLEDYGQWPGRGVVVVTLQDIATGDKIRFASGHLSVKTNNDARNQAEQIRDFVSSVNNEQDDLPIVAGFDLNNRQPAAVGNVRGIAQKYGYRIYGAGIDVVMANFGAAVSQFETFDLGNSSDHDGRRFLATTNRK